MSTKGVTGIMLQETPKVLQSMAGFRLFSGTVEIVAALLMLKFGDIKTAFQINAALGLVGPSVFIIVSALGVAGLSGKMPLSKIALLLAGVSLIIIASRK